MTYHNRYTKRRRILHYAGTVICCNFLVALACATYRANQPSELKFINRYSSIRIYTIHGISEHNEPRSQPHRSMFYRDLWLIVAPDFYQSQTIMAMIYLFLCAANVSTSNNILLSKPHREINCFKFVLLFFTLRRITNLIIALLAVGHYLLLTKI